MGKFGNRFEAHAVQPGKAFWTNSRDMFYRKRPEELLFLTKLDPQHAEAIFAMSLFVAIRMEALGLSQSLILLLIVSAIFRSGPCNFPHPVKSTNASSRCIGSTRGQ